MANSILTPTMITREALRVLHGKTSFIGSVNRQYDDQYGASGAKIGSSLNIRMPPKYTVRTNATLAVQDHVERSTPLSVSSQYGVDVSFTTVDLTLSLDDFSKRFINPAMSQLAAKLEADALSAAYKTVANYVGTTSTSMTYLQFQQAGASITNNLAPYSDRTTVLRTLDRVNFSDAVKGLFQSSDNIAEQYKEGIVGRTGGFDVYENTFIPSHTRGSLAGSPLTTGATIGVSTTANVWASQTSLTIDTATSATTLAAGDVVTVSGIYEVHPETKVNTGSLKKFVVQSAITLTTLANTYTATVVPAMIYGVGNAFQNCVLSGISDTDNNTVTAFGVASTSYGQSLAYHKDAFVFATADLVDVSNFGAWGARQSMDGISMRIAKQYAIASDTVPCRIDVLWGFAPLYPELAVRHFTSLT
jgi:hypothetical protein